MNAINFISPYTFTGQWVFDDPERDLIKEPFVAGADTFLDYLTDYGESCNVTFSSNKFPDAQLEVSFVNEEYGGAVYSSTEFNLNFWLCPAMFKYFDQAPKSIYLKIK